METWMLSLLRWWTLGCVAVLLLPPVTTLSSPMKDIHKLMTNYELSRIFGSTSEVPEYEIASVKVQSLRRRRYTDYSENEYHVQMDVQWNNKSFQINLRRHSEIISKDFEFTVRDGNGAKSFTHPTAECLYHGVVLSEPQGQAALANCDGNGMTGLILMQDQDYILQPLPVRFQEQKALSEDNLHIIYPKKKMSVCGVNNNQDMLLPPLPEVKIILPTEDSHENMIRKRRATKSTKYIETAVFVDDTMYNNIARDSPRNVEGAIKEIVFAMINMVQLLYNQPSSTRPFKIVLVKLEIFKTSKSAPSKGGGNIKDYLTNFCHWQSKANPDTDRNPRHWDHAILLSGLDLFQDSPDKSKVIGLAWVSGMCRKNYSCSVNEGNTFESAYVITHELGHNLGMPHDGDDNKCDSQKYIMSPSLGPGKIGWSSCSMKSLDEFVSRSTSSCLEDTATATSLNHEDSKLPGEKFPAQSQCDHAFGSSYKVYTVKKSPFEDICRELWCARGTQAKRAHPALDGTPCGYNRICRYGSCVSDNRLPKNTYSGGREQSDEDVNRPTPAADITSDPSTSGAVKRQKLPWRNVSTGRSARVIPEWLGSIPDSTTIRQPIHYFKEFFSDEILNHIVEQSNIYSVQKNLAKPLQLTVSELEQFIGMVLYMSLICVPRTRLYWSSLFGVPCISDIMSRDRWEEIKSNLHFNDNMSTTDINGGEKDKLFKLRPLINNLLQKFNAIPMDHKLCVDEQMVPFKGMSSLKQYMPKKPCKWGYKIYVLCDSNGIAYNFEVYCGKSDPSPGMKDLGACANVVLRLAQVIPKQVNHLLYFDNWFTTLPLVAELAALKIFCLGTVRANRLLGCMMMSDKELKAKGRGAFEEKEADLQSSNVRVVKWYDNRSVVLCSTFSAAEPVGKVKRWDKQSKEKVEVECPSMVIYYNKFMGGVDLLDSLIALYRITIRSKKYYHRFFFHFLDMVVVTSWLLYRRDCNSLSVPLNKQSPLFRFKAEIADALCRMNKDLCGRKRGRPSTVQAEYAKKKKTGHASKPIPQKDIRLDNVGHWAIVSDKRGRCKFPNCKGSPSVLCQKCGVYLYLEKKRNCFLKFHKE